mmetsp:Transcript_35688/g.70319  ORF Transcript_35688/g.70319 Transcript_35688/m.70319 type:complete len:126 (+) Transcript_35688:59-436(+)
MREWSKEFIQTRTRENADYCKWQKKAIDRTLNFLSLLILRGCIGLYFSYAMLKRSFWPVVICSVMASTVMPSLHGSSTALKQEWEIRVVLVWLRETVKGGFKEAKPPIGGVDCPVTNSQKFLSCS